MTPEEGPSASCSEVFANTGRVIRHKEAIPIAYLHNIFIIVVPTFLSGIVLYRKTVGYII